MFNNIFETDEERKKRLLQQTQPDKPMEQMSTREALEYAWDQSEAKNKAMENQNQNTNFIMPPERKPRYAELNFDGEKLDWIENDQIKKIVAGHVRRSGISKCRGNIYTRERSSSAR